MANHENPKPGCFSNFFKVLLCAGNGTSPPVYPSDHVEQVVDSKKDKPFDNVAICTPGVVARLMGLDSLPNTNLVGKNRAKANPDSVPRSRSVNFVDYLLEFDLNLNHANQHRRVKTSASFREVPSVVFQKQNNPFVFEIDSDDVNKHKVEENGVNLREFEKGHRKREGGVRMKKEKNKKISKLRNEPRRVPSKVRNNHSNEAKGLCKSCSVRYSDVGSSSSSCSPLPNREKKGFVEPKIRNNIVKKKKVAPKKMQTEHSLENLSPVSVLDINDYAFLDGADFLGTSALPSKSNWKSSVAVEDHAEEKAGKNKGYYAHTDVNKEAEYYSELMLKIRTLTEEDVVTSKKLMCGSTHQSFEEICLVFAHTIFDLLLLEVVDEVVQLSS